MKLASEKCVGRKTRLGTWLGLSWIAMICVLAGTAQSVATTSVQGIVYLANGTPGSGTLTLSWPAFTTSNGVSVAAGILSVPVETDGSVSVNLAPNLGASPAGLFYTAVYHMSDGTVSTEYSEFSAALILNLPMGS